MHFHQEVNGWLLLVERHNNKIGSGDSTIRLWDVKTGVELKYFEGHTKCIALSFSSTDKYLASASGDATIRLWDT